MKRKTIRIIIFLALFTVIGVFSFQLFWVNKAYNIQEKQFNDRVHVALSNVVHEVQLLNKDSAALYEPVKQVTSNYFLAFTNDTLHPYLLENLLKNEFKSKNLDYDFEYIVYDCFNDSIVFGNYVDLNSNEKKIVKNSTDKQWEKVSHYFGVYFPEKELYIIDELSIWIVSTIFLLLVVIFFSYTIWVILQQKKLSEVRTDFINNMTHELKTPISTISLSAEVLTNPNITKDPERLSNYANIIKEETERLKNQVEKVLQMATLDKKKVEMDADKVDMHDAIDRTVAGFEIILDASKGIISTDLNAENYLVKGDKMHLTNVLFNLIDNAIKYAQSEPEIVISTEDHKDGIYIRVRDNGIGMTREQQKHVFEKFYRVPTGNVHDVKGFGIGLNYVRRIVGQHKGKIQLKSQLKSGSTFRIYLPKYKNDK
jgi:two-component system phosphate regulon sensor histidine kinase PhoR